MSATSKLYATMNDLELAEVAGEPTARSEWAFEALRDEMTKRGLDWAGGSAALATLREAASVKTDESGSAGGIARVSRHDGCVDLTVWWLLRTGRAHQKLVHKKSDNKHIGVEPCGRTLRLTIA